MTRRTKDSWKEAYLKSMKIAELFYHNSYLNHPAYADGIRRILDVLRDNMPKQTKRYYLPPKAWGLKPKRKRTR